MPPTTRPKTQVATVTTRSIARRHVPVNRAIMNAFPRHNAILPLHAGGANGGQVRGIPDLPVDVLVEIFGLLHPVDLLNLACTSKAFRSFLMNRRSMLCWKMARRLHMPDLPECPPELSEPKYARLLFFVQCSNCGVPPHHKVDWKFLASYCNSCAEEMTVGNGVVERFFKQVRKATGCDGDLLNSSRVWVDHELRIRYHKAEFEALRQKWQLLGEKEEQVQFVQDHVAAARQRYQFKQAVRAWEKAMDKKREVDRAIDKDIRYHRITQRLFAEGWGEELKNKRVRELLCSAREREVSIAEPLTDDDWLDIRDRLIETLEETRTYDHTPEQGNLVANRLQTMYECLGACEAFTGRRSAASDLRAEFADVAKMPLFRRIVNARDSTNVTRDDFLALLDAVPNTRAEWYHERECEFRRLIKKRMQIADDVDPLSLAVASFDCRKCTTAGLRWPNVLAHRCARAKAGRRGVYADALENLCNQSKLPYAWTNVFDLTQDLETPLAVIEASGRDPLRATFEEMEASGQRFFCKVCSVPALGYMETYTWKEAVYHKRPRCDAPFAGVQQSTKWAVLDAEHTASVIALETTLRAAAAGQPGVFGCTRCRFLSNVPPVKHVKIAHDIDRPLVLDEDYYDHPDSGAGKGPTGPILIYTEAAHKDRIAKKDVKQGRAFFSPTLFQE